MTTPQSPQKTTNVLAAAADAMRRGILPMPQLEKKQSDPLRAVRDAYAGIVDDKELTKNGNDIIMELVKIGWQKIGQQEDPPNITADDLRKWIPPFDSEKVIWRMADDPAEYPEPPSVDPEPEALEAKAWHRFDRCYLLHNKSLAAPALYASLQNPSKLIREIVSTEKIHDEKTDIIWHTEEIISRPVEPIPEIENHDAARRRNTATLGLWMITTGGFTPFNIVEVHLFWCEVKKMHSDCKHPLAPIVQACLQTQRAKPITRGYDARHPVAVLKSPLGSIKEVNFLDSDAANLREFAQIERQTQIDQYLFDFVSETPSILPAVMPLDVAHPLGVKESTRKGAVHHVIRVFFEALMALEPMQTEGNIAITLGDLISYLYSHGKFHRTNQLPYIINALDILHFYATVPYRTESGNTGRWRPVVVRNTIDTSSSDDDHIYMDVKLPPDATQGMMVEKHVMRRLGQESAPRFNAYLMACWLWDKFGTGKKGLIDPTKPIEIRDTAGDLLNTKGEKIFDSRGKSIQNLYHDEAITQLPRERNPAANRYPILSFDDLILACKPSGYNQKRRKRELDRALKHWEQLAMEDAIQIEKNSEGWRIMPSKSHISRYRGLRKAAKKAR